MKKPLPKTPEGSLPTSVVDERFTKKYPHIMEHLSCSTYEDGSAREKSALSIFTEEGSLKVALNDREEHRSCYVTSDSVDGALAALESALSKDTADWRVWGKTTKRK